MPVSIVSDYRRTMAMYLVESFRAIQQLLSEADFGESVPHVFGQPTDENVAVSVRNECGLLIRKAQMHVNAALRADKSNNLHSLGVHMRVVLECVAQVVSKAQAAHDGTPKALARILNASEKDFRYAMFSPGRGRVGKDEIQGMIIDAREKVGNHETSPPNWTKSRTFTRRTQSTRKTTLLMRGRFGSCQVDKADPQRVWSRRSR